MAATITPSWLLLAALLAAVCLSSVVRAQEADQPADADAEHEQEEQPNEEEEDYSAGEEQESGVKGISARVHFLGQEPGSSLVFPAGEKVHSYVGFENKGTSPVDVFIVAAHINQLGNPFAFVQNYTAVKSIRKVPESTTVTLKYDFTPDVQLEPMDYNLVVRLYFVNAENTTFAAVAYNSTVTIGEPLGIDFKALFSTVMFIGVILGGIFMLLKKKTKLLNSLSKSAKKQQNVDIAASSSYDPDYIPKEHKAYRDQLLKRANKGRAASPNTEKK